MITCCKVENCVGKGSVFWGYGAAVWGILGIWCCSVGYFGDMVLQCGVF